MGPRARIYILAAAVALTSCASPPTSISEDDIASAQENGSLSSLYVQVEAELAAGNDHPQTVAMKARIGTLLAQERARSVEAALGPARLPGGRVPIAEIERLRLEAAPIEEWDPTRGAKVTALLAREEEATRAAIQIAEERLGSVEWRDKLATVALLIDLNGAGSAGAARWEARRDEMLRALSADATAAIAAEDFDEAQEMLHTIQALDPDAEIGSQIAAVDSKVFEQRFWKALEDGNPDEAFLMLREISKSPNFDEIRPQLAPSSDPMADFFVALAADTTAKGDLPNAYRWFRQAREIREILGQDPREMQPDEAAFVKVVTERYWEARRAEHWGLAWAYLSVVDALEPPSPSLKRMTRETREAVEQRAIKRLSAMPFEVSTGGSEFGEAVSAKVIQHLFESIPQDLRIIEREQLEDILRERDLGDGNAAVLAAADYLIQGDILEARVDTNEKHGRVTKRIVTETVTQANPAYVRWLQLSDRERGRTAEPPQSIQVEKKEDISYDVTVHRKVGIISVSYRVIEAGSGKVMFTDSLVEKIQHEDESTEGVDLGDFQVEFRLASLPSDLEILQTLANLISGKIGSRLVEVLQNPEDRYEESGRRFIDEGNFAKASEQFAYAHVLAERKGKDVSELGDRLRDTAMRSIERPRTAAAG